MRMKSARPALFNYRSSQAYLADLFEWYKGEGISMRNLAGRLRVSPSLLCLISKGKRPLTQENIDLWSTVLGWNAQEASWLKQVIIFEYSSPEEKEKALLHLSRFQHFQDDSSNMVTFKYLRKWWNVAIREMSELPDFIEDPQWINERLIFKVSLEEIRKSLKFLNKHALLAKHGNLRSINCDGDIYKLSLSGFHDQILGKAVESIYKISSEERHILGHTMTIPEEKFPEARIILEEALRKISALRDSGKDADKVYHFSFLVFPLTSKDPTT